MDFFLSPNDRDLILASSRDLFLALVFTSGQVKIRVADPANYPGHAAWLKVDQIDASTVVAGFSFIVKDGAVTGLFASSELNRTSDWKLDPNQLQAVCGLLPMSSDVKLY